MPTCPKSCEKLTIIGLFWDGPRSNQMFYSDKHEHLPVWTRAVMGAQNRRWISVLIEIEQTNEIQNQTNKTLQQVGACRKLQIIE